MKRILLFFLTIFAFISASAAEQVAIFVDGNVSDDDIFVIESKISEQLSTNKNLILLQRTDSYLDAGDKERAYQLSGEVDSRQICKLGQRWAAKYVIAVSAREVRGTLTLTVSVYDVTTGVEILKLSNHKKIKNFENLVVLSSLMGSNLNRELKKKL